MRVCAPTDTDSPVCPLCPASTFILRVCLKERRARKQQKRETAATLACRRWMSYIKDVVFVCCVLLMKGGGGRRTERWWRRGQERGEIKPGRRTRASLNCFHMRTSDIVFLFKFRGPYQRDSDQMRVGGFEGGLDSASSRPLMGWWVIRQLEFCSATPGEAGFKVQLIVKQSKTDCERVWQRFCVMSTESVAFLKQFCD